MKRTNQNASPECVWAEAHLLEYLDETLNPANAARMERHLQNCASCREHLAQQRLAELALSASISCLPDPGDLRAGFYARLAESPSSRSRLAGWSGWNWKLAAPACAAVLLFAVYSHRSLSGLSTPVPVPQTENAPQVAITTPTPAASLLKAKSKPSEETSERGNFFKPNGMNEIARAKVVTQQTAKSDAVAAPTIAPKKVIALLGNLRLTPDESSQPSRLGRLRHETFGRVALRSRVPEIAMLTQSRARRLAAVPMVALAPAQNGLLAKTEDHGITASGVDRDSDVARHTLRELSASLKANPLSDAAREESNSLALNTPVPESLDNLTTASKPFGFAAAPAPIASSPESDDFSVEVQDDERHFIARTKIQGKVETDGDQIGVTINADDDTQSMNAPKDTDAPQAP